MFAFFGAGMPLEDWARSGFGTSIWVQMDKSEKEIPELIRYHLLVEKNSSIVAGVCLVV